VILDTHSTKRASAKFYWSGEGEYARAYHLICDDDIIYPPDYVSRTIETIDEYEGEVIIGMHGVIFHPIITDVYSGRKEIISFWDKNERDREVHLLGTGVLAFDAEKVKVRKEDIEFVIACDESLAMWAKRSGIKMICMKHEKGWVKGNEEMQFGLYEVHIYTIFLLSPSNVIV